ncbi:ABC transporter permease [Kitasatospora herbaricolor]|uniref:ABC transporter permease n=1 Tax=Kitasatospora herbaricolor TaxID=68217 RepID=UPI00174A67B2|nr:ABC transporter permease [Kitasatospora herbaricolor]MDQ0309332.1 putative ABC transport system permease protein [Kitasatospora herbaricolor]GGV04483.1 ABC transporter permease [Kitasatospora herbaricolor]
MFFLALSTLRARKGAFAGAFVALMCAAALVTACGALLETGLRGRIPTERYAGTPLLVTADQELHRIERKGDKTKDKAKALTERAWLDARTADRLGALPGVRAVVPELTFPAEVLAPGGGAAGGSSWGHAWESAVLTPFGLDAGRAPAADDEIVLDAAAARRAGVGVGGTVTVQSGAAPAAYRVVGVASPVGGPLARQSALFFTAGEARRLAGRPGQVAAIGLLPEPGADLPGVRARAVAALAGTTAEVRAGDALGPAEFLAAGKARVKLISMGAAMGGTSLLVALLVVTGTFSLSVQQRVRELALLRAIGATPRQLRRTVGREALVVGLLAGLPGALAGLALAGWLHRRFLAIGALPDTLHLLLSPFPPVVAVLATLLAGWGAARVSARRPARVHPTEGLAEAAAPKPRSGALRLVAGLLAAVGHVVLVLVLSGLHTDAGATPVTFLSVVLAAVATALLGPPVVGFATAVLGRVVQALSPAAGFLAAQNARAQAQRLAAVVTPLSLAVAMASTILFTQTTTARAAGDQLRTGTTAPFVLAAAGPGVPRAAADAVRGVAGVEAVTEVVRSTVYSGPDRFPAQGVTPRGLGRTMDPGVTAGSLDAMGEDTVAVSRLAADTRKAAVGGTLPVTLGDGVTVSLRVVAVYEHGLGFGDLLLPVGVLAAHVDNPLASSVLVAGTATREELAAAAGAFPAVRILGRAELDAVRGAQAGSQAQVNYVAMGLIIAFTGIAVVNTLVMATAARRREFALLRLIGTTGRQVRAMLRWETLMVVLLSVGLGSAVAYGTLAAYSAGMTGAARPYAPPLTYLGVVGAAALLAFVATALPARLALRADAAGAIGARE